MKKQRAEELRRLNRALRVLSACNKALAQATSEQELLNKVCDLIVRSGAYRFAWIGYAENNEKKSVRPVAYAGQDNGYLSRIEVTWSVQPSGRGPMGAAIREDKVQVIADVASDPAFAPWRNPAESRGYMSVIGLPLRAANMPFGALGIYSQHLGAFQKDEVELLEELASNLAYGIGAQRADLERRHAVKGLEQAEAKYRQLVEQVPAVTYVAQPGPEGRWHYVSPQIETILGFKPQEWIAHSSFWREQMHPDDLERVLAAESTLQREGDRFSLEYRMHARDGHEVWVRDEATYVSGYAGEWLMRGLLFDITERKRAEQALQRSEENYRMFVANSSEGIFRTEYDPPVPTELSPDAQMIMSSASGYVAECNDVAARMYGFNSASEMVGKRLAQILVANDPETKRFTEAFINAGYRISDFEKQAVDVSGKLRTFYVSMVGFVEDGKLVRVWGVQRDVTESIQLQEQVRSMQQLEAVGRLAGGVAHDFNNIMNVIIGHADLLLASADLPGRTQSGLTHIRGAAAKAASLTQQLLAFSRRQVLQPKVLDLNETVADVQRMLARVLGEDIEVITLLDPGLSRVKADPGQMHQVLMNLAVNARDAMPNGGKLVMSTANAELDEAYASARPGVRTGAYAMLVVSDTGHGMDAETASHIFEPFFTTKEIGKGTGLGLATVYGIVKQSGGHVSVYSEPGKGSTFRIYLPAERGAEQPVPVESQPEQVLGGNETILLVEDEADLREVARIFLSGYGYEVLNTESIDAALQLAEEFPRPIHLLLTDVIMPKMSGRQLAERVLQLRPDMKVVYMTGYTEDMVVHHKVLEPGISVLQKPFTRQQLGAKVRAALDLTDDQRRAQSAP